MAPRNSHIMTAHHMYVQCILQLTSFIPAMIVDTVNPFKTNGIDEEVEYSKVKIVHINYYFGYNVGAVRPPLPQAYGARTKGPVLCTHYGFNKGIQTVYRIYPTPICVK